MVLNRHHLLPHVPVPAFFTLSSRIVWYMHLPRGVPGIGGLSSPASLFLLRFVPYSKVCKRGSITFTVTFDPSLWYYVRPPVNSIRYLHFHFALFTARACLW